MENPYVHYYANQAGNGISAFSGQRFQRGHGFFGRIFSSILPVLKFLGRKALSTGVAVAQDTLKGDNIKQSLKRNIANTGAELADSIANRARGYSQTGQGYKKRKYSKSKKGILMKKFNKRKSKKAPVKKKPLKNLMDWEP